MGLAVELRNADFGMTLGYMLRIVVCVWVDVKIVVPFLDPYSNTAPYLWSRPWKKKYILFRYK